ncbi:MAG: DUF3786 domain-containing protein [Candidatus Hydrogenedentota bacterium]|nr:MAG: DUF3786 domain-containing protein [Candidatus Hydrogenedentota bacterium]
MEENSFLEEDGKIADLYWKELNAMDPADVCRRSLARYDEEGKAYELRMLNDDLLVYPEKRTLERISQPVSETDGPPDFNVILVSVHYLIRAKEVPIAREYVTENELTDGSFFFRGPHALPSWRIERAFARDAAAFLEKGTLIGGTPIEFGDVGLEFLVLPRIQIAYVLWVADDEFPARAQILFDASADKHLALDAVWAMCNLVTDKLLTV